MIYHCCSENTNRRSAIRKHPELNGVDFLEVRREEIVPPSIEKAYKIILEVHFLKALIPLIIEPKNIQIVGGEKIDDIAALHVTPPIMTTPPDGRETIIEIELNKEGDFSIYELRFVEDNTRGEISPLKGIDRLLSSISFSFKADCPTELDCKTEPVECVEEQPEPSPNINYLVKDYASFRQLMYDRIATLIPNWETPNPASLESNLVELLAYTADYLSYRQDAITSEAYLGTARKLISASRHARLLDYFVDYGSNAKTWLHLHIGAGTSGVGITQGNTKIVTKINGVSKTVFKEEEPEFKLALKNNATIFEPMEDVMLYAEHNEFHFYTFGEEECCLPKGATSGVLKGDFQNLKEGDVIILSEIMGPETGVPNDANPKHRHAVRLTNIVYEEDINLAFYLSPSSPPEESTFKLTRIEWQEKDALPFTLCISTKNYKNVSVAYGNNVLVDHGYTIKDEKESSIHPKIATQKAGFFYADSKNGNQDCEDKERIPIPIRYNPILKNRGLTFSTPLEKVFPLPKKKTIYKNTEYKKYSIAELEKRLDGTSYPSITLHATDLNGVSSEWIPMQDLLTDSAANNRHFVVEMEADGIAHIRFGNDKNGKRPNDDTSFKATYRIGTGIEGNIGANTLAHLITDNAELIAAMRTTEASVWNPLPTFGGRATESMESIKQYAPQAFRTQERAVTLKDYEEKAISCNDDVQKATANRRWTGSWHTNFIAIDRKGDKKIDDEFKTSLINCLDKYRMAGTDLAIDAPIFISLDIIMSVCVKQNFFRGEIKKLLQQRFSSKILPNGKLGFFHPDNFSFGQPLYLSSLYALAQGIEGVQSVEVIKFQRQGDNSSDGIDVGKLTFGREEIARLDNNPNFRNKGIIQFEMKGGR